MWAGLSGPPRDVAVGLRWPLYGPRLAALASSGLGAASGWSWGGLGVVLGRPRGGPEGPRVDLRGLRVVLEAASGWSWGPGWP